jgi:hypothetical protein
MGMNEEERQSESASHRPRLHLHKLSYPSIRKQVIILTLIVLLIHFLVVPLVFVMPDWILPIKFPLLKETYHPAQTYARMSLPHIYLAGAFSDPCLNSFAESMPLLGLGVMLRTSVSAFILTILLLTIPGLLYTKKMIPAALWIMFGLDFVFLSFWVYYAVLIHNISWGLCFLL